MGGTTGGRCQASNATREYRHKSKDAQDDCSASYAVRDGESSDDYLPREETGSDRDEDV